ncbi:MAG: hypothetical protein K2L56_00960 [Prevotella sp.]|nr:hypothetical protein [Prevotella sp.]
MLKKKESMITEYDRQILMILSDVGENGISVQALAKHVHNMNCTLFFTPDAAEVHRYVQQYLLRNSRQPHPLVETTGQRGHYRLNTKESDDARQLMLEFHDEKPQKEEEKPKPDLSLDMFA